MSSTSDIVRLNKLETRFTANYTLHKRYVPGNGPGQKGNRKEERWKRQKRLGRGGYSTVWLEECIHGDEMGKLRAVKEISKEGPCDYHKELEAIFLFSHDRFEQCFVKSFGWYEDDDDLLMAMEYMPQGDLHRFLGSPLPENEGRSIVAQILDGLQFMHEYDFAHRDLKPKNILVAREGPDWWIKIADFGISKRAIDGVTALRTTTGTPAFVAPEIIPDLRSNDTSNQAYTKAVDIWSLSVITYFIVSGQVLFEDPRRLSQYIAGTLTLPLDSLIANGNSMEACSFLKATMVVKPENRLNIEDCQRHPWFQSLRKNTETSREIYVSKSAQMVSEPWDDQASARWSTQDQKSTIRPYDNISERIECITLEPESSHASIPKATTPGVWRTQHRLGGHIFGVKSLAYSPDGKQIASGSFDDTIKLWDTTGTLIRTLYHHQHTVLCIFYSQDGKQIVSASDDGIIILHSPFTGSLTRKLYNYDTKYISVAYSPDGAQIAAGALEGIIKIWDAVTGFLTKTLSEHQRGVKTLTYLRDGTLASASTDGVIKFWDLTKDVSITTLKLQKKSLLTVVAFSLNGRQIASASRAEDGIVTLWDVITDTPINALSGHTKDVLQLAFSPDGMHIASASLDKTVKIWNVATGTLLYTLCCDSGVSAVTYSPDGKHIACGGDSKLVTIWEYATDSQKAEGKVIVKESKEAASKTESSEERANVREPREATAYRQKSEGTLKVKEAKEGQKIWGGIKRFLRE